MFFFYFKDINPSRKNIPSLQANRKYNSVSELLPEKL